jgi:hypothetical protein
MNPQSTSPASYAGWIAAPKVGIDNKPGDFEYVKIAWRLCPLPVPGLVGAAPQADPRIAARQSASSEIESEP